MPTSVSSTFKCCNNKHDEHKTHKHQYHNTTLNVTLSEVLLFVAFEFNLILILVFFYSSNSLTAGGICRVISPHLFE